MAGSCDRMGFGFLFQFQHRVKVFATELCHLFWAKSSYRLTAATYLDKHKVKFICGNIFSDHFFHSLRLIKHLTTMLSGYYSSSYTFDRRFIKNSIDLLARSRLNLNFTFAYALNELNRTKLAVRTELALDNTHRMPRMTLTRNEYKIESEH